MDDERYYEHEFSAPITVHRLGTMTMRVIFLPEELAALPPFSERPRLRFEGEIGDVPIRAAWQPAGPGRRYVMLGKTFLRDLGRKAGDVVEVRFRIVGDDDVPMPPELAEALAAHAAARKGWAAMKPARQRGLAHMVAQARTPATRTKRIAGVLHEAATGEAVLPMPPTASPSRASSRTKSSKASKASTSSKSPKATKQTKQTKRSKATKSPKHTSRGAAAPPRRSR